MQMALRFGVRQLAATFSVDAGSRQLAGGLNSVLCELWDTRPSTAEKRVRAQQAAPVENCHSAKRQQASKLPHSKLPL